MYTVESILATALAGTIMDRPGRMIRGARVFVHDAEIMCLVVSDKEVYWSAHGTAVSEDWLRRYLEQYQHQAYIDPQGAPIVLPTLR